MQQEAMLAGTASRAEAVTIAPFIYQITIKCIVRRGPPDGALRMSMRHQVARACLRMVQSIAD